MTSANRPQNSFYPRPEAAATNPPFFENQLIDRNRLCEIIGLAPGTISKLMAEDGLLNYKIGKACRFKMSEVMAFLEKRKRQ